jgi:transcriptional enhancer factor
MEQWSRPSILPSEAEVEKQHHYQQPVRVLGDTSGNVQTYPQEFKPGIENQVSVYDVPSLKAQTPLGGQYNYPPAHTLPSNDHSQANIARLHARRQRREHAHVFRRRFDEVRPYLQCHKYTDYRARRRQDTGDDGKPVWDDPMEEAFQNGTSYSLLSEQRLTVGSTSGYQAHGQKEEVPKWETQRPQRVDRRVDIS